MPPVDIAYPYDEEDKEARSFAVEGNDTSGFYGVSHEYRNYPDDRMKPFRAEGGPEAEIEERAYSENVSDVKNHPNEAESAGNEASERDDEQPRKAEPKKSARGAQPQQSSQEKAPEKTSPGVS